MSSKSRTTLREVVARLTGVRPEEAGIVLLSAAYFFFVLSAYYVIRPIREAMGVAGGTENVKWLITATAVATLLAHPIFAALVSRWPRRRFVGTTYRFFMACLVAYFLALNALPQGEQAWIWVGRTFYVWISVFNLFVVSIFWSFMIDIYRERQSRRLFALVGVGGTVGAIVGSSITAFLVGFLSPTTLLWFSVLLLECAVGCVKGLDRRVRARTAWAATDDPDGRRSASRGKAGFGTSSARAPKSGDQAIGGSPFEGIARVFSSPYLLGICAFMLLFTIGSTFLYNMLLHAVDLSFPDPDEHPAVFARIDLVVNILALLTQLFLTGRIAKRLGVALTLSIIPLMSVAGFLALATAPVFAVVVVFHVLRRAGNFAVAVPMREVLYTVLSRRDKYKSKNFNDTLVYRTGDQIGAWSFAELGALGLGTAALAWTMVPVAGLWLLLALWLGRKQQRLAG